MEIPMEERLWTLEKINRRFRPLNIHGNGPVTEISGSLNLAEDGDGCQWEWEGDPELECARV